MCDEKPEVDFEETDAIVFDEEGKPRVKMETLQKHGRRRENE
jgi:hypothetical protein